MKKCITSPGMNPRRGAILMEFVIGMFLFLVLIGGIFWVGEIYLARNKAILADRYASWAGSNRHDGAKGAIQGTLEVIYYPNAKVGPQEIATVQFAQETADHWYDGNGSRVDVDVEMPVWTEGWLRSGQNWDSRVIEAKERIQGRAFEIGLGAFHSVLLARNPISDIGWRTFTPGELAADAWRKVNGQGFRNYDLLTPWATERMRDTGMPIVRPIAVMHERHEAYVDWSE